MLDDGGGVMHIHGLNLARNPDANAVRIVFDFRQLGFIQDFGQCTNQIAFNSRRGRSGHIKLL
jgi:hypothetical protein